MFTKFILTLFAGAVAAVVDKDEGVLVLTDSNFDGEVANHPDGLLVEFYAPWCGHCKSLAPEYAKAAGILAAKDPPRYIAKVDATENEKTAKRFDVSGYPTLKWIVGDKDSEYSGGRTSDTIVSWIMKKTGPAFSDVACDQLIAKTADTKVNLVLFGEKEGATFDAFHAAAKAMDHGFIAVPAECAATHNLKEGLAVFRNFDESPIQFEGDVAEDAVTKFVQANAVSTCFEFTEDSVEPIFHNQQPVVLLMLDGEAAYKTVFEAAAKEMKGEILFSYSGVTEGIQEQLGEFIGVTGADLPTMRILSPSEEAIKKFKWDGDMDKLTVDDVKAFVADFKAGKLVAHTKSEAVPESNDGPVKVVVGTEFVDIVMDPTKDVLVKYYAPWCGHCKTLAPHWEKLGEHVKDVSDLIIAKYDATANENAEVNVEGFPTLKFYPKGNKEGVVADGRSFDGLRKWLGNNSEVYKTAFPDEVVVVDEAEEAEPEEEGGEMPEGEEGEEGEGDFDDEEDMGEEGEEEDMGEEGEEPKEDL